MYIPIQAFKKVRAEYYQKFNVRLQRQAVARDIVSIDVAGNEQFVNDIVAGMNKTLTISIPTETFVQVSDAFQIKFERSLGKRSDGVNVIVYRESNEWLTLEEEQFINEQVEAWSGYTVHDVLDRMRKVLFESFRLAEHPNKTVWPDYEHALYFLLYPHRNSNLIVDKGTYMFTKQFRSWDVTELAGVDIAIWYLLNQSQLFWLCWESYYGEDS